MEGAKGVGVSANSVIDAAPGIRERRFAIVTGIILSALYVAVMHLFGGGIGALAVFPVLAVLLTLAGSFELTLAATVICLYVDFPLLYFSSAVLFSSFLAVSFIIHRRDIAWKEFANPMTVPILVYGLCIVPSFLNASQPGISLYRLWNVAAFLIVLYTSIAGLRNHAALRKLAALYLGLTCANGVIVIVQSLQGEGRPFGVPGIMYVDYSALGVCIAVAMIVVSRGRTRVYLWFLAGLMTVALILTQTRNTWISCATTLAILSAYVIAHPDLAGLPRKKLVSAAVVAVFGISVLGAIAVSVNPRVEKRALEITPEGSVGSDQSDYKISSLMSRYFIWDTALNAFLAHPYAGIGVYAFPYSSRYYSTLPEGLYDAYVEGTSPHQTQIAVLTETGIVGMVGYLVFIIAAVRVAFRTIGTASGTRGKRYGFVAAIALTYCIVSMTFTDAWLWGQGIVLLGLVMGLMLVNRRISVADTQPATSGDLS